MMKGLYLCVYVDDILIFTEPDDPADEMQALPAVFKMWSCRHSTAVG